MGDQLAVLTFLFLASLIVIMASGFVSFVSFRRNEANLKARIEQQELMSRLAQSLISHRNISSVVDEALRLTGEFLAVSRVIMLISEKGESRAVYEWKGGIISAAEMGGFIKPSDELPGGPEGWNYIKQFFPATQANDEELLPLFCNNVKDDPRFRAISKTAPLSFIWTPLYVDRQLVALLSIEDSRQIRAWSSNDRQLINTVSSVITGVVAMDLREKERDAAIAKAESAAALAADASQAKGSFLANMSHEMRTPMNAIIGMTSIAKNAKDIEQKEYCLGKIEEASVHLLSIINDILDMSKIEAGKFELSPVEFNFEKMLQKVVNVIAFRVDEKHQKFTVHIDRKLPSTFLGDDQRLSQVITNLLSNAVKFTPEEGIIRLNTSLDDSSPESNEGDSCVVKVSVADSGIGMSKEQRAKLFTSFEQADSSTSRKFGGTGLGLAISKRIVEMMGGEISVQSEPEKGSVFTFTVRLKPLSANEKTDRLAPGVNWKNLHMMVIDDDSDVRAFFQDFAEQRGLYCRVAGSAEEALKLLQDGEGPFNLYFVDWRLPGMDGIELSREIKTKEAEQHPIVIIISASEWASIEPEAKKAGISKYISKPLFPSAITDRINECLEIEPVASNENQTQANDHFPGKRILLVEDVEINREIVCALLEPTEVTIDCAEDGKIALNKYKADPALYDCIFMDIQMPEMDGYEAARLIRAYESENGLKRRPIIAMTANVFREDIERCLAAGMDGHVGKPLEIEEVLKWLRKYLA